jgi:hypothetical protein
MLAQQPPASWLAPSSKSRSVITALLSSGFLIRLFAFRPVTVRSAQYRFIGEFGAKGPSRIAPYRPLLPSWVAKW